MSRLPKVPKLHLQRLILVVLLIAAGLLYFSRAYGALLQRSLTMGDSQPSSTTSYIATFDLPSNKNIGSIKIQLCANSPLEGEACTAPTGTDLTAATLSDQTGEVGFSISPLSDANTIILTRTAALSTSTTSTYTFDNVINPSAPGVYYGRLETFASEDATGANNDFGGVAFDIANALGVTTTVPPYLLFCSGITITGFDCATASGNYVNLGNFSSTSASSAQTQMLIATNAGGGYNVRASGNTLTSGNNIINAIGTGDVSRPGVSQFGINLAANTTPAVGEDPQGTGLATVIPGYDIPNFYKFVPHDVIVTRNDSDEYKKFTVSYVVNVSAGQPVGIYVTTLTYVCLANF
jgi:hypothetical protein